jgi:hypothetical protein
MMRRRQPAGVAVLLAGMLVMLLCSSCKRDYGQRILEAGSVLDTDGTPSDIINCGYPSYQVAFHWCTGAPSDQFTRGSLIGYNRLSKQETTVVACGPGAADDRHYEKGIERVAVGLAEVALSGDAKPFLRPMVTSFEQGYEYVPSPEPCSFEPYVLTTTLDARAAQAALPGSLWDNQAWGSRELQQGYEALKVPQCAQYQRMSWWNRDCSTARSELLLLGDPPLDGWDPATGRYEGGDEDSCLIREARCFGNRCADGRVAWLPNGCPDSMSCNAGGWCVPESTNPFRPVVLLEPSAIPSTIA